MELFGRTNFPPIGEVPYFLTLSPHSAFWFSLEPGAHGESATLAAMPVETLAVSERWNELLAGKARVRLEGCLPAYLQARRWFAGKNRVIKSVTIRDMLPITAEPEQTSIAILLVEYVEGDPDEYVLPLAFATGSAAEQIERDSAPGVIARIRFKTGAAAGILYDALVSKTFNRALFEALAQGRTISGREGDLESVSDPIAAVDAAGLPEAAALKADQSNTLVTFGDKYLLKVFRRIEPGIHPEVEMERQLTLRHFPRVPKWMGSLEYRRHGGANLTLGYIREYIPDARDGWTYTIEALGRYFERALALKAEPKTQLDSTVLDLADRETPDEVTAQVGTYLESARLLGKRTGELHLELGADCDDKDFAPEPFTPFYQRSLYQSLRNRLYRDFQMLSRQMKTLPERSRAQADRVLRAQGRHSQTLPDDFAAAFQRHAHTMPRRFSSRGSSLYRQGFFHHRF